MPVLLKAKSIDKLIENARILKKEYPKSYIPISILINKKNFLDKKLFLEKINLENLKNKLNKKAMKVGFKANYFKDAYILNENKPIYTEKYLNDLGMEIIHLKTIFNL